jgi:hypothetical protein
MFFNKEKTNVKRKNQMVLQALDQFETNRIDCVLSIIPSHNPTEILVQPIVDGEGPTAATLYQYACQLQSYLNQLPHLGRLVILIMCRDNLTNNHSDILPGLARVIKITIQ